MHNDYQAIVAVLGDYFDALYFCDVTRLASLFHPGAQYVTVSDGTLLHRTMDEYFPVVAAREPPARRNEARREEILRIEFAGPATATVRATCIFGGKHFTDCLTLIKLDGRWQIISKVFHSIPD
jgi:hypothetical protein